MALLILTAGAPRTGSQAVTPADPFAEIVTGFSNSFQHFLELPRTFWDPNEEITLTDNASPLTSDDLLNRRYKGRWERLAAVMRTPTYSGRSIRVRLSIAQERTRKLAWHEDVPIDVEALAEKTRKLVPGKTVNSVMDASIALEFHVKSGALPPGSYRVFVTLITPDGSEHPFHGDTSYGDSEILVVRPAPFDARRVLIGSSVEDSPEIFTRASVLGNPGQKQFPLDTPEDCQARSIWSLQTFQGRVFVGYGDWDKNRGPINLWSFAPLGSPNPPLSARNPKGRSFSGGQNPEILFTQEYVVQDHSIDLFRSSGERLYAPGMDGMREKGPDGDLFSNLYVREKGFWRKLSSIPQSLHTLDVLETGGRLYVVVGDVTSGKLLESLDGGLSWKPVLFEDQPMYAESVSPFRDETIVFGAMDVVYLMKRSNGRGPERHAVELSPGMEFNHPHRIHAFLDGVVYTTFDSWGISKERRHPLFFLRDFKEGVRIVSQFKDAAVRDILVESGTIYVLTAEPEGDRFVGCVYSSKDLAHWTCNARFPAAARPNSFARLDGTFYVGLSNRGYDAAKYAASGVHEYAYADKSSGSILRLER